MFRPLYTIALLLLFTFSFETSRAQPTVVAESAPFNAFSLAPGLWQVAYIKVIGLSDGGAAVVHVDKKGFDFMVYNADHSLRFSKKIPIATKIITGLMGRAEMLGCFQTGEYVTVLIQQFPKRVPELIRIVLNPKTGELIREEKVHSATQKVDYYFKNGLLVYSQYFVRKADYTDNYAVVVYNQSANANEKIQVIYYDGNNKEIAKAYLKTGGEYSRVEFLDMVVLDDQEVVVLATSYEDNSSAGVVCLGSLVAGEKKFRETQKIEYSRAGAIQNGLVKFNKATDRFNLLTVEEVEKQTLGVQLGSVSRDLSSLNGKALDLSRIANIAMNEYGKKEKKYGLVPQNMFISPKGAIAVLLEGLSLIYDAKNPYQAKYSEVGDVGVLRLNKDGNAVGANYIPKKHTIMGERREMSYARDETKGGSATWDGFKSFYYVPAGTRGYVLMNDLAKNQDKIEEKKDPINLTAIGGAGGAEAFYFDLAEGNIPSRQALFPNSGGSKWVCFFAASDYNKKTKTLVTLAQDVIKKKGMSKIVWVKMKNPKKKEE